MTSDILGYVVVEWNQASGQPNPDNGMGIDDLESALKLARMQREGALGQRGRRYTVHAVMAAQIEEAD